MVELQVTPMAGDILQIGSSADIKLPAGQTVDATATILTDVNMHAIREVTVTYYIWGVPLTTKTTIRSRKRTASQPGSRPLLLRVYLPMISVSSRTMSIALLGMNPRRALPSLLSVSM